MNKNNRFFFFLDILSLNIYRHLQFFLLKMIVVDISYSNLYRILFIIIIFFYQQIDLVSKIKIMLFFFLVDRFFNNKNL